MEPVQAASSSLDDMIPGTNFSAILDDPTVTKARVDRIICLSGKLYYDLIRERQRRELSNVAFVRIEELCPFPFRDLSRILRRYPNAKDIVWLQEEPRNQGAYMHVHSRINEVLKNIGYRGEIRYRGRDEDAVPAPGVARIYGVQQKGVIDAAFEGL